VIKIKINKFLNVFSISELGRSVKIIIYEGLPHGFWSYDVPQGLKEAKVCVNDAVECMKELLLNLS